MLSFGGSTGVQPLQLLEQPFTDAAGPRLASALRFDQDNTIADRPMVQLLHSLDVMLDAARHRAGAGGIGVGTQVGPAPVACCIKVQACASQQRVCCHCYRPPLLQLLQQQPTQVAMQHHITAL